MDVDPPALVAGGQTVYFPDQVVFMDELGNCFINVDDVSKKYSSISSKQREFILECGRNLLYTLSIITTQRTFPKTDRQHNQNSLPGGQENQYIEDFVNMVLKSVYNPKSVLNSSELFNHEECLAMGGTDTVNDDFGSFESIFKFIERLNSNGNGSNTQGQVPTSTQITSSLLHALKFNNPLYLHHDIFLKLCADKECNCHVLKWTMEHAVETGPNKYNSYLKCLTFFLYSINHQRIDCSGDGKNMQASPIHYGLDDARSYVHIPLHKLLLGAIYKTDVNTNTPIDKDQLTSKIMQLPYHELAILSHIYVYLIFSRHKMNTGCPVTAYLRNIITKIIKCTLDVIFCTRENSTSSVDTGRYEKYIVANLNIELVSPVFNTASALMKTLQSGSMANMLDIISPTLKDRHYNSAPLLVELTKKITQCMADMNRVSTFAPNSRKAQTKPHRYRVQLPLTQTKMFNECYIPFGVVAGGNSSDPSVNKPHLPQSVLKASNGNNLQCNVLHLLPQIQGCANLGNVTAYSDGCVRDPPQSNFELLVSHWNGLDLPENIDGSMCGTGNTLGFLTSFISRSGVDEMLNRQKDALTVFKNQFLENNMYSEDFVNQYRYLPHESDLYSRQFLSLVNQQALQPRRRDRSVKFLVHELGQLICLLMWQTPNIEGPNISSLAVSQMELLLSKGFVDGDIKKTQENCKSISILYAIFSKQSMQFVDALSSLTINNDQDDEEMGSNSGGLEILMDMITCKDKDKVLQNKVKLLENAVRKTKKQWQNDRQSQKLECAMNQLYDIIVTHDYSPAAIVGYSSHINEFIRDCRDIITKHLLS